MELKRVKNFCSFEKMFSLLFTAALAGTFLGWSYFAVEKFWQQPLSTQITYTTGDDGTFIKYPLVTICSLHPSGLDCLKGKHDFWKIFQESCLEDENLKEKVESYINAPPKIVSGIALKLGNEFVALDSDDLTKVLSTSFHEKEGKCQTIDINKSSFNPGMINAGTPRMRLLVTPESWIKMFVHNEDDLPMAEELHPYLIINPVVEK